MAKRKFPYTPEEIAAMTPMDDIFMGFMFDGDIPAAERLVRTVLGRDDIHVTDCICQKPYGGDEIGDRGVRLDIFATDDDGRKYDFEIQKKKEGASPQRARFNSAKVDVGMLSMGQKFTDMAESYVVFITEDDYFGEGLPKYVIDRVVRNSSVPDRTFGDGSHIIYVNGQYRDLSDEVGKLMHDFHCSDGNDMCFPELRDSANKCKDPKGGRSMEEFLKEYFEEYFADRDAEAIIALYNEGNSSETLARCFKKSPDEINAIIAANAEVKAATA